jgi:hypothetical protein
MHLIDADALIDIFEDRLEKIRNRYGDYSGEAGVCAGALHLIRVEPTIEERKTGKWILHPEQEKNIFGVKTIECSECGDKFLVQFVEKEKYCRNCGAKMEAET